MDLNTGPGVSARYTGPFHARQTAVRTPASSLNANKGVSDIQPPDTDRQLASPETSNVEGPAPNAGQSPKTPTETRPASVQVTVTEDRARSGRPLDDSGYGPSLWTGELGTSDGSRAEAAGANRYNISES